MATNGVREKKLNWNMLQLAAAAAKTKKLSRINLNST